MNIRFFLKSSMIIELKGCISDLNTLKLFNANDKKLLNPIYERDLDRVVKKTLPFGFYINEKVF